MARKRLARQEAQRLLREHSVSAAPVPVEKLARALGAIVQFGIFDDELSGFVYVKDGVPMIGVNEGHHQNRQRFTIAHEIGHLILHKDRIGESVHVDKQYPVLRRDQNSATGVESMEIEANAFAAELLMPEALLKDEANVPIDIDDEGRITILAKRFKVSPAAMRNRLLGLFAD